MDLASIASLFAVIGGIVACVAWLARAMRNRLTPEEEELLVACAANGLIRILELPRLGTFVGAGSVEFYDQNDPAFAARYVEALLRLQARGYATRSSVHAFDLTGSGFDAARALARKRPARAAAP